MAPEEFKYTDDTCSTFQSGLFSDISEPQETPSGSTEETRDLPEDLQREQGHDAHEEVTSWTSFWTWNSGNQDGKKKK